MDDQLITLSKIFTERIFRIPDYQRGYAWNEKQLKDFWNDIQQLEPKSNHYTGVLTLETVTEEAYKKWEDDGWIIDSKNYQPFYVVDGQQRLTTSIILIQVIIETIKDESRLNYTQKQEIQRKFIFDTKMDSAVSRSYIFGYEKDNPSYEFLKTKIFGERSSTNEFQETVYTNNLQRAKDFFQERIKPMEFPDVENLYRKVTQHLLFNTFTITNDVDVCVAFETMNNRGKPLSYLELLKNRLIYLSLKFPVSDHDKNALRSAINSCWKDVYHYLGRNREQPLRDDDFLATHGITYFGLSKEVEAEIYTVSYRKLINFDYGSELLENRFITKNMAEGTPDNQRVTVNSVYNYVNSLQDAVRLWYQIWNPLGSDLPHDVKIWLDKMYRLKSAGANFLILSFFQQESSTPKRVEFLKALERTTFLSRLYAGSWSSRPARIAMELVEISSALGTRQTTTDKVIKQLKEMGDKVSKDHDYLKGVVTEFNTNGFYDWEGIYYFLFEYNLDLQQRSKTDRAKIFWAEFHEPKKDHITVEHIFPRQARHPSWQEHFGMFTQKQRTALRNSLGNLLPLSRPKNSSLSNKTFDLKKTGSGDSIVGYMFGSYSENEVCREPVWGPDQIFARGMKLVNFLERRWDIKIGDQEVHKKMLGLAFLE